MPAPTAGASATPRVLALVYLALTSCTPADTMTDQQQTAARWYEAFSTKDPALIDSILSEDWADVPAAPGQAAGRDGAKQILRELTAAFPDLTITVKDVLQDGAKVVVRTEITGTQRGPLFGIPATNRTMTIMAIDIHEFHHGKIVRTWHTEDWLAGLGQLGALGGPPRKGES